MPSGQETSGEQGKGDQRGASEAALCPASRVVPPASCFLPPAPCLLPPASCPIYTYTA